MAVYKDPKPTKDGRYWYFKISYKDLHGKPKQYRSKRYETKHEAQDAERLFKVTRSDEINDSKMSFKTLYDAFFEYKQGKVKMTTIRTYINREPYIRILYDIKMNEFSIKQFEMWKKYLDKQPQLATRTKHDIYKFLKCILNFGAKYFNINITPYYHKMEGFKDPSEIQKEMDYYTYEEFMVFIEKADTLKWRTLFEVLYYCGLRRGELRGLTWDNINLIRKTLTVNKQVVSIGIKGCREMLSSPKTQKSNRTIPLPDVLVEDLKEFKESCKSYAKFNDKFYVFGDAKPIPPDKIRHEKAKIAQLAGLREIRLHDFRHSCASLLINNGANVNAVAHYLGHTKIEETLNTYTHLYESTLTTVTNLINQLPNKKNYD